MMHPPKTLTGEALQFWRRNARKCEKIGTLTPLDRDAFVLLCEAWAKLQEVKDDPARTHQWVCVAKQVATLTKAFGLTRESRKKLGIQEPEQQERDEFGL
jgi:phage terminase small subunit